MTIDQLLLDLQPKQILRQTDRQTLNCRMTTLLTMVSPENENVFKNNNKKKIMKTGAFVQVFPENFQNA